LLLFIKQDNYYCLIKRSSLLGSKLHYYEIDSRLVNRLKWLDEGADFYKKYTCLNSGKINGAI